MVHRGLNQVRRLYPDTGGAAVAEPGEGHSQGYGTGEVFYAKGNTDYSGYYGMECQHGNCSAVECDDCTEPNDHGSTIMLT